MKKQLLIITTLIIASIGYSQSVGDLFTENFIDYQVSSITPYEVKIDNYDANGGAIVNIPANVTNMGTTYSVTTIDQTSFFNKGLTSVTIPNTITTIETAAFTTNNLTSITIPNSVISIGISSFQNNQITDLVIPSSVTNIAESAFKNNPLITINSLAMTPPTITTGGGGDTFNSDRSGIDLTIPTGTSAAYVSAQWTGFNSVTETGSAQVGDTFVDNFITYEITSLTPDTVEAIDYDMAGGTVVNIPSTVTNSAIPYNVVGIGNSAFYNKNLSAINLPNSLVSIGDDAFRLNQISSLTIIPNTVTSIGERAFRSNQLTSVIIPNGVIFLGSHAFAQNLLTSADIADSVTTIEGYLFWQNSFTDLSNVIFPLGTTDIPEGCFYENPFTNVVIPEGITSIGDVAFEENLITSVTLPSSLISIGNQAFKDNQITNITIPNGVISIGDSAFMINQLVSLDIPDSVTNMGNSAFKNNVLTSVVLGNGIASIGELCFQNNQLTNIAMSDSVTTIQDGAFENNLLTNIVIPSNVTVIQGNAFIGNPLTSVTSENTTPPGVVTGSEDTFAANRGGIDLIIPTGTTNDYLANGWTGFNSVTEAVLSVSDYGLANTVKVLTTPDEIKIVSNEGAKLNNYAIYNISGAKVASGTERVISKSFLAEGVYILKLTFNKGTLTKKVIVN
ncbi:leucine-rich repeat domain-containing protein [Psychroserpens mesophilus]|uniref:leucine-rich repeat domain-containing protein n=2 Tax=Psychroserpens mesophilus TaxID=325473 RepID=UPI00069503D6|nr:leucine-rich repeat domain-containing protein [Psychroserpens mesophilus]